MNYETVDIKALYKSDIEFQCLEYISMLPDESLIYKKSNIFLGLLEHIYNTVLYPVFFKDKGYNNDYALLDRIFYSIYLPLNYRYGYTPTLYSYASFVHINANYFTELLSGVYHDGSKVNSDTTVTVSKWFNTCKAATLSRAIDDNSIGAIFAAKSAYGMSDQPQQMIDQKPDSDIVDISAITDKYRNSPVPKFEPIE